MKKDTEKPRLYLDIDYVLNSDQGFDYYKKQNSRDWKIFSENQYKNRDLAYKFWDKNAVNNLKKLIKSVDLDIYIHSNWKRFFELDDFKQFFDYWKIDSSRIKGIVPQYKLSSERYHDLSWHISGDRIQTEDKAPCKNYVIIDDYDMTDIFVERGIFKDQIVTNPKTGLTEENVKQAIKLLKK